MKDILKLTAVELSTKIKAGELTAVDAVEAVFAQIAEKEDDLHCYVTLDKEGALLQAKEVQEKIEKGELTRAACRCSGCDQGQYVHRRYADNLFFQNPWQLYPNLFFRGSSEPAESRCCCDR